MYLTHEEEKLTTREVPTLWEYYDAVIKAVTEDGVGSVQPNGPCSFITPTERVFVSPETWKLELHEFGGLFDMIREDVRRFEGAVKEGQKRYVAQWVDAKEKCPAIFAVISLYVPEDENKRFDTRVRGWFPTFEEAREAILSNNGDLCEFRYGFACIEKVYAGFWGVNEDLWWFTAAWPIGPLPEDEYNWLPIFYESPIPPVIEKRFGGVGSLLGNFAMG